MHSTISSFAAIMKSFRVSPSARHTHTPQHTIARDCIHVNNENAACFSLILARKLICWYRRVSRCFDHINVAGNGRVPGCIYILSVANTQQRSSADSYRCKLLKRTRSDFPTRSLMKHQASPVHGPSVRGFKVNAFAHVLKHVHIIAQLRT